MKSIVRLALAAATVAAVALPATPAHADCITYRTYTIFCPPE